MRLPHNPHTLANEIRLKRTQHAGAFLLVEGPSDSRLLRRFIDTRHCHIAVGFDKRNVLEALQLLQLTSTLGVLAIVDADFDTLNHKPIPKDVVRLDCHDVEAMLIRSPALDAVLHEYGSPEKVASFELKHGTDVRSHLIKITRPIGYLRWFSENNKHNLRFEGLSYSKFVDTRDLSINPKRLGEELRNHSQAWSCSVAELVKAAWPDTTAHDPWHLCCGHDLVEVMVLGLRKALGSREGLRVEELESALRLAFGKADFIQSAVLDGIRNWEEATGFRVLPNESIQS